MIEWLTDYLIKRRLKKEHITVPAYSSNSIDNFNYDNFRRNEFKRVLNTLRENKVMVCTRRDGIYIRLAGNEDKGQCFSLKWAKVKSFDGIEYDKVNTRHVLFEKHNKYSDDN